MKKQLEREREEEKEEREEWCCCPWVANAVEWKIERNVNWESYVMWWLNWNLKVEIERKEHEWMNEFGWIWIWKKKSFLRFLSLFRSLYLRLGKVTLSVSLMLEKQRHGNSFTHVIALFNIFSVHSFLFYFTLLLK
jgi:hypothetical protein